MGIIKRFLGPKSKYDKDLPFTYFAKVPAIEGDGKYFHYYFADTICGLIEYLEEDEIAPDSVQIFGAHLPEDILIDVESCTTDDGKWLRRPDVCRSLEERYKETLMDRYRGHVEGGGCSFEDRDRKGKGPF